MNAFVLSSGGNLGSIQSGMALALYESGVVPDMVVGTSVGAINAAVLAANPTAEGARHLADLWGRLGWRDVFGFSPFGTLRSLVRWRAFFSSGQFARYLRGVVPYERIEDAAVPLRIVATTVPDGAQHVFDQGPVVDAILASTALPGLFPPHEISGRRYVDGAATDRIPLGPALDLGADVVHVLSVGAPCPPPVATHMSTLASRGIEWQPCAGSDEAPELHIVWIPSLCVRIGPYDFRKSATLLERARLQTARFLQGGFSSCCDHAALEAGLGGAAFGHRRALPPRAIAS